MTDRELERMRRHREAMEVAIAEGLTLDAARERVSSYRAHLRRLAADSVAAPTPAPPRPAAHAARPQQAFWWNKD